MSPGAFPMQTSWALVQARMRGHCDAWGESLRISGRRVPTGLAVSLCSGDWVVPVWLLSLDFPSPRGAASFPGSYSRPGIVSYLTSTPFSLLLAVYPWPLGAQAA